MNRLARFFFFSTWPSERAASTTTVTPSDPLTRLDIGTLIKREVDRQHWSYTDFARAIHCSRSSLYNMFNSRDISLMRYIRICKVLDCDLLAEQTPCTRPLLSIPLGRKGADLSELPQSVLEILRAALDASGKPT